ncbi:MAG: ABC transporter substrate-binding protein [Roseburia sp.]|nr:ABC transporter substrate-binding protein [Roseburia sp.]
MYKRFIGLVFVLVFVMTAWGCAGAGGETESPAKEESAPEGKSSVTTVDWKNNGFAVQGEVEEEQGLWIKEYISWEHEEAVCDEAREEVWDVVDKVWGEKIYRLYLLRVKESSEITPGRCLLEVYDTGVMNTSVTELTNDKTGLESVIGVSMDVMGEQEFVFHEEFHLEDTSSIHNIYSDSQGAVNRIDMLPIYYEEEIINDKGVSPMSECICDKDGNLYVRAGQSSNPLRELYLFDREGKLLMSQKFDEMEQVGMPLRTQEGELIFPVYSSREKHTRLVWFDWENNRIKEVALLENELPLDRYGSSAMLGMQGNSVYYKTAKGIVKWDVESGARKLVFDFRNNAVPETYNTMLVMREGQAPLLRMFGSINEREEDWLVVLSEEPYERQVTTLSVVNLVGEKEKLSYAIAAASRRNPDYYYEYRNSKGLEAEDFRTRIMAEIMSGECPDILYVTEDDMEKLQSMGLLADIKPLIPGETLEQFLPGVIEMGTSGNVLVGLPPEVDLATAMTLKSIWQKDSWTVEDLLELLETGDYVGLHCQGESPYACRATLNELVKGLLEDSWLVDWEKGECHFDDERFLKILEAAKAYGDDTLSRKMFLGAGGCLYDNAVSSVEAINERYERYGEECFFVGNPNSKGNGHFLISDGMIVVSKDADTEAVRAFLECLLSEEVQYLDYFGAENPVSKISLDEIEVVENYHNTGETEIVWSGWRGGNRVLERLADGRTILHIYKELLEKAVPGRDIMGYYNDIINILWEEAEGYFAGDKSTRETAEIINSRVQVYLYENQ